MENLTTNFAITAYLVVLEQPPTLRIGGMLVVGFGLMTAIGGFLVRLH